MRKTYSRTPLEIDGTLHLISGFLKSLWGGLYQGPRAPLGVGDVDHIIVKLKFHIKIYLREVKLSVPSISKEVLDLSRTKYSLKVNQAQKHFFHLLTNHSTASRSSADQARHRKKVLLGIFGQN